VQHGHVLEVGTDVDSHADWTGSQRFDGEQALHVRQGAYAHAQSLTVVHDLGRAVLVDDVDDAAREAVLAAVEEEDPLERMALPRPCARPRTEVQPIMLAGPAYVE
jgi:hypothetical protein